MPTYEYACDACGTTFELFQSITEPPVRQCPECKRRKVRRLIGPGAALIFRGSGFYVTDYRSSEYQAKAKAEAGQTSGSTKEPAADKPAPTKDGGRKHGAKKQTS